MFLLRKEEGSPQGDLQQGPFSGSLLCSDEAPYTLP